ncbi:MAG: peptidase MA family metallohydrolase [Anaerolineales bacterium]|nr:peptidase MA family metallohydrolase [Anaerolineales bacterium]
MRLASLGALLLACFTSRRAAAQVTVTPLAVVYAFGEQITFVYSIQGDAVVQQAQLFFQAHEDENTISKTMLLYPGGVASYRLDLTESPLQPFTQLTYWVEASLAGGGRASSERAALLYEDNRYPWKTHSSGSFQAHWYQGDVEFGQMALEVAEGGLENIQDFLPLPMIEQVDIYIYSSAAELRDTLQKAGQSWVGAHADPELEVMLISLMDGPEQRLEMERQIPHELMHILLYHRLGEGYDRLPAWLNEGLASMAELYPNPDYQVLLENARQKGEILSITSLCAHFPRTASEAFLAYAQADSFTRYLHTRYGARGMQALVGAYADGQDCEGGMQAALHTSLEAAELAWRREALGEVIFGSVFQALLPWALLLLLILAAPLGITLVAMTRKRRPGG